MAVLGRCDTDVQPASGPAFCNALGNRVKSVVTGAAFSSYLYASLLRISLLVVLAVEYRTIRHREHRNIELVDGGTDDVDLSHTLTTSVTPVASICTVIVTIRLTITVALAIIITNRPTITGLSPWRASTATVTIVSYGELVASRRTKHYRRIANCRIILD
jgi:hypothetical protein